MSQQGQLFGRKWDVTVANAGQALDLSPLRIYCTIEQSDVETPNHATIRIYNLSDDTSSRLLAQEFDRVVVSAGYVNGPYGVIFDGTIKQSRRGRIDQIDKYLDILAADGDLAYNYGVVNTTLAAGSTLQQQIDAIAQGMGVQTGYLPEFQNLGNPNLIRGKVMYGLGKDLMRNLAISHNFRWSIQQGRMVVIPNDSYIPGEAIVLSSSTGMLGFPEQTQSGISVRALLNPKLVIGQSVKIDNADIQSAQFDVAYAAVNNFPSKAADGLYRVVVSEFEMDTRDEPWWSKLTCFAINPTSDTNSTPSSTTGAPVNPWPGSSN